MALARALAVEPSVLLLDEPFGALDARVRKSLRQWLRRLHDEVHVTTVFVTHDQEEAMEVADEIVVMNEGRVEQVGVPRLLYEEPSTEFVMTSSGGHESATRTSARTTSSCERAERRDRGGAGAADRPPRLRGPVEFERADGEGLVAQLSRSEAEELELAPGDIVWVRPTKERIFR